MANQNLIDLAFQLQQSGNAKEAIEIYIKIISTEQSNSQLIYRLGTAYLQAGLIYSGIEHLQKSLTLNPECSLAHNNLGVALRQLDRRNEALEHFDNALHINSDFTSAHNNRGLTLYDLNRPSEALKNYDSAIALKPNFAEAFYNRGNALLALQRLNESLVSYSQAIAFKPSYPEALCNRGNVLKILNRLDEAILNYRQAISVRPDYPEVFFNLANTLLTLQRRDESLLNYDKVIMLKPGYAEAYCNRGVVLQALKRLEEALKSYNEAIRLKPDYAEAFLNRGNALQDLKQLDEALESYDEALRLNPDYEYLFGTRLHTRMKLCEWTELPEQLTQLESLVIANQKATVPFSFLALTDDPAQQLLASKIYVESRHPASHMLGDCVKREHNGKIRIGYFSADFHNHATSYLIAELFETHDASQFELYGFSYGSNKNDEMRKRVSEGLRQFVDVSDRSDLEVAKMSRELGIDIAVDLKGFTTDSRTGIFALCCAPIQVSYLGYPGTMGADYFDYIVADHTLIPQESQHHYTEKVVYMPHSYQVNDSTRKIANRSFTKLELGLPQEGFVFCCFNNNYKILPATFDSWMRLLTAVKGSVLWLLEDNPTAAINLRKEAELRGIDASRLVFAKRMKHDEHLARHSAANLFIDTFPCNAHTTASDALWAGLPVLTLMGQSFASRVAASLLNALDLSELITLTQDAYEARAIELAMNPDMLEQIRAKLYRNRLTSSLFNGHTFAKHLEAAYSKMYSQYSSGLAPSHIVVQP